jgi:hypothetical protein
MEICLFCNEPEPSCKPEVDFICGSCVVLLTDANQADLKTAYQKALNEGYLRKVSALESFIIPEGKDEQRKPESKKRGRYSHRDRIIKSVRNQKERIKRVAV